MTNIPPEFRYSSGKEGIESRLLSRRHVAENGCWEYTGALDKKGYGRVRIKGTVTRNVARIAAWLWLGFDIESDLLICHHCDNPKCFNPEHLFAGTVADNMADAARKGRLSGPKLRAFHARRKALKTHCPHGHRYSPENTLLRNDGSRGCRTCLKELAAHRLDIRRGMRKLAKALAGLRSAFGYQQ